MSEYILDKRKPVACLLYICQSLGGAWDKYSLLKILYFAECKHLMKFGRPITGDDIRAMEHGPVPAFAYDLFQNKKRYRKLFAHEDGVVKALEPPYLRCLSESEIECMDDSIYENKLLNFAQLKRKSMDAAYQAKVKANGLCSIISYVEIARAAGAKEELITYVCDKIESIKTAKKIIAI